MRSVDELIQLLLGASRNERAALNLSEAEWWIVSGHAAWRAVELAEIAEYAAWRGGGGTGDYGHDVAMRHAQQALRRVRKAVGFTYP